VGRSNVRIVLASGVVLLLTAGGPAQFVQTVSGRGKEKLLIHGDCENG